MRIKILLAWALALLLALAPVYASAAELAFDIRNSELENGIWHYASHGASVQEWIDNELAQNAGGALDNYILCLVRDGVHADFSKYVDAAAAKLEAGISNASTRQRTALALIACGARDRIPADLVDESAGKLGIMSWIWALHLVLNGAPSELWTAEALVDQLLSMQLEDGGWKVTGEYGDVDVTCMCLQALAYCGVKRAELDAAIERAVNFLADRQQESGGFASMGNENAESSAQVLIALASLGIDYREDARFLGKASNVFTEMTGYVQPSGGFSHLPGGDANGSATVQVLQALLSVPGEAFYDFREIELHRSSLPGWKYGAFAAIGGLTLFGILFALTRRRGRLKQLIFVLAVAIAAAAAVWFIRIDSAESYYNPNAGTDSAAVGAVTLSIRCDNVAGRADDGSTPEDGVILPPTEIPFSEGETVFDALTTAVRRASMQMEHTGAGELAYINGINNLYEFAYGDLSGWLYSVNGEMYSTGCGAFKLSDGDDILWQYTTELGEDLK